MRILTEVLEFIEIQGMDKVSFNDARTKLICKSDIGILSFSRTPTIANFKPTVNFQVLLDGAVVYAYSGEYISTLKIISLDKMFDSLLTKKISSIHETNKFSKERFNMVFGTND